MHSPIKLPKSLSKKFLYHLLEEQYEAFNHYHAISIDYPDPLGIARKFKNEKVALFCALFAYGNARAIVRFLETCKLDCLQESRFAQCTLKPYRFQTRDEIQDFFEVLLEVESLYEIFYKHYKKYSLLKGIESLQYLLYQKLSRTTSGLEFLIGKPQSNSPLKRWNMFLRWMVRDGSPVDLGLWSGFIDKRTLVIPMDTHVLQEACRLGLLESKTASMSAARKLTARLALIFPDDPLKGDFALFGYGVNH